MKRSTKLLELYFHIPFCVSKCLYCDFLSGQAGKEVQDSYIRALLKETLMRGKEYSDYRVPSVFIGGGTPSVVDVEWIEQLMELTGRAFQLEKDVEITMEVNPKTADETALKRYRNAGINRLSIGLQSARDEELARLGRIHTFGQFKEIYEGARAAGFRNINVDIMSGLPGQTPEDYRYTLERILALKPVPEHISAYSLIVEEGTAFERFLKEGTLALPDDEDERLMYADTARILGSAGYHRYEISNYCRTGYECRHNIGYWSRTEYLGLGLGAASLVGEKRFSNGKDMSAYLDHPTDVREQEESLSREAQMEEFMFLGLRLVKGVERIHFFECFGVTLDAIYGNAIGRNVKEGLLVDEGAWVRLTDRGLDLSNYVMAQFLMT